MEEYSTSEEHSAGFRLLRGALAVAARLGPATAMSAALFASSFFSSATVAGRLAMSSFTASLLTGVGALIVGCFTGEADNRPPRKSIPPEIVEQTWAAGLTDAVLAVSNARQAQKPCLQECAAPQP